MAASFIGLTVIATLLNGSTSTGKVTSIDEISGTIVLSSVTTTPSPIDGQTTQQTTELDHVVLERNDLAGLKVISIARKLKSSSSKLKTKVSAVKVVHEEDQRAQPVVERGGERTNGSRVEQGHGNDITEAQNTRGDRASKKRSQQKTSDVRQIQERPPYYEEDSTRYAQSNHDSGRNEAEDEFDFGAGLLKFDKHAIFEQIRDQDDTDPALRLHSHNRNTPRNIGINESVLAPDELREQRASSMMATRSLIKEETENQSEYEDVIEAIIVEKASKSRSGSARREHSTLSRRVDERIEPNERKFYTADGIPLVAIKLKQYREVLSIADIETGPTLLERTENAARGIASLILTTLPSTRLTQSTPTPMPTICIFANDMEKGLVVLRMGVHICNRGIKVVVFPVVEGGSEEFRTGLRVFSSSGGRIIKDLEDLSESYSLLVDALSGNEIESTSNSQSAPLPPALLSYISQSTSPILSIDTPYGKDHDTSSPLASRSTSLSPDYLVCRGAVRKNAQASYDTYLVDVGLGPSLWARAGVDGWEKETFGAEFVVQCYRS